MICFDRNEVDRLASADIIEALGKMEQRPWPEWRNGKPITRQLAALLKPFDIKPDYVRIGPKDYLLEWFTETFSRYLGFQSATSATSAPNAGFG